MLAPDSNVWIAILRGRDPQVEARYRATPRNSIVVPSIVAGELYLGAEKGGNPDGFAKVDRLIDPYAILPFGEPEMRHYARLRAHLERTGQIIGANDLIIAATALAAGATLVTHNTREFSRVPGLSLVDWQI